MTKDLAKNFLFLIKPILFMCLSVAIAHIGFGGAGAGGSMGGGPFKLENPDFVFDNLEGDIVGSNTGYPLAFVMKQEVYQAISINISRSIGAREARIEVVDPINSKTVSYKITDLSEAKIENWDTIVGVLDSGTGLYAEKDIVLLLNDQYLKVKDFQKTFKLTQIPNSH